MAKVPEYHTNTDPEDPVYHVYDDCPAGKQAVSYTHLDVYKRQVPHQEPFDMSPLELLEPA